MPTKLKLDLPDYSSEYQIISICCTLQDYHLSWHLNKLFNLILTKSEDFEYLLRKTNKSVISSLYLFLDEKTSLDYHLLSNRNTEGFLIPEHKQTDYFFLIKGPTDTKTISSLSKKINAIPNVLTAYPIDFQKLKDINSILSELELHLMTIRSKKTITIK